MASVTVERRPDPITSVPDFLTALKQLEASTKNRRICFRGHADAQWRLIPPIGRRYYFAGQPVRGFDKIDEKDRFLHRFRRSTFREYRRVLEEWEGFFLARHHRLPVRLLDWTFNPLAALYFGCESAFKEERQQTNGAMWALVPKPIDDTYLDMLNPIYAPICVPGVKLVYPYHISPRITAQTSVFTIQDNPSTALEEYDWASYSEKAIDIHALVMWSIDRKVMPEIVGDLERLDINNRTLFPDFDGLCRGLLESEIIKKATESALLR
jgi:hypothetical protein